MFLTQLTLRSRLILISVAPAVFMAALFAVIVGIGLAVEMKAQVETTGLILSESIANAAEYSLLTKNKSELSRLICTSLNQSPNVQGIEITDADGQVQASCNRSQGTGPAAKRSRISKDIVGFKENPNIYKDEAELDLRNRKAKIGEVHISTSSENVDSKLISLGVKLLTIFCLVVTTGIFFAYLFSRRLACAMDETSQAVLEISQGRFEPRFTTVITGEVGQLQHSILEMAKVVGDFTHQLENQVQLRTADLQNQKKLVEESNLDKKLLILRNNDAIEKERRAIAFDLHDTMNTILLSVIGHVRQASVYLSKRNGEHLMDAPLENLRVIELNASRLYTLSRDLVTNLRPEVLDEFGLGEALNVLVSSYNRTNPECAYIYSSQANFPRLNYDFNIVIYRIVQESLSNVVKHSAATKCHTTLQFVETKAVYTIFLTVSDNGKGFDTNSPTGRTGLVGMRERAEGIGANLNIISTPGSGTEINLTASIPV